MYFTKVEIGNMKSEIGMDRVLNETFNAFFLFLISTFLFSPKLLLQKLNEEGL